MTVGPANSREDIIAMVLEDACGEYQREDGEWRIAAQIGEHQEGNVDLSQYFDVEDFLHRAGEDMDDNREGSDEDGNHHPLESITGADQADLDRRDSRRHPLVAERTEAAAALVLVLQLAQRRER